MKRFLLFLVLALIAAAMFARGGREHQPVDLTFFSGHGSLEPGTTEIIAAYEAHNPGVTITAIYNSRDYATQFQSMLASNTLPDIALVVKQLIPQFAQDGTFRDLSDRPAADLLFDVAREPNSYEGKLYAIPTALQGYGLQYNPDLFEQAGIKGTPQTLSELRGASAALREIGVVPFTTMVGEQWATGQYLLFGISPILAKNPGMAEAINSGRMSFNNDKLAQVFEYIDIMRANQQPNAISYAFGEGAAHFGGLKSGMTVHGEWILRTALGVNPDLKLTIVGIPYTDNPEDPVVVVGTADGHGVIASTPRMKETLAFFDYYTSVESGQIISTYDRSLVPLRGFDASALHPVYQEILSLIESGQSVGWEWIKLNPAAVRAADVSMQAYMNGDMTREEVLQAVEDAIDLAR